MIHADAAQDRAALPGDEDLGAAGGVPGVAVGVPDADRGDWRVARGPPQAAVTDGLAGRDGVQVCDAGLHGHDRGERGVGAQVRRSEAVRGQSGPGERHARQAPQAEDGAAVRGVRQQRPGRGGQGVQHRLEAAQLLMGERQVGFVGAGEVGVRAFQQAPAGQFAAHGDGLVGAGAQAVHAGVDLQVRAGVGGQRGRLGQGRDGQAHAQVRQDRHLGGRGRREQQHGPAGVQGGGGLRLAGRGDRQSPHVRVRGGQGRDQAQAVPVGVRLDRQDQGRAAAGRQGAQVAAQGVGVDQRAGAGGEDGHLGRMLPPAGGTGGRGGQTCGRVYDFSQSCPRSRPSDLSVSAPPC